MGFLDLAKKRHTTYDFSDKKVSDGAIAKILEAGRWAPSLRNSQPWNFILVKDSDTIDYLTRTANYGDFHSTPSLIIAVVLRKERSLNYYKGVDEGVSLVDSDNYMCCSMAALQMVLEAEDLGIDSCFLTPQESKAKNILGVKSVDSLPVMIGFGYKRPGTFQKVRERVDLKEITFKEYFGRKK